MAAQDLLKQNKMPEYTIQDTKKVAVILDTQDPLHPSYPCTIQLDNLGTFRSSFQLHHYLIAGKSKIQIIVWIYHSVCFVCIFSFVMKYVSCLFFPVSIGAPRDLLQQIMSSEQDYEAERLLNKFIDGKFEKVRPHSKPAMMAAQRAKVWYCS